MVSEVIYI